MMSVAAAASLHAQDAYLRLKTLPCRGGALGIYIAQGFRSCLTTFSKKMMVPQVSPLRPGILHANAERPDCRNSNFEKASGTDATRSNSHAHSKAQLEYA